MAFLTVNGARPYDGRYELDINAAPLTTREWGWVKRYAGYLPATLDGNAITDPEMVAVLAIVAIRRAGRIDPEQVADLWERFADAPFGTTIVFEPDTAPDEGDADGPPAANSNGSENSSGPASKPSSAGSEETPEATGTPASAISTSLPVTWGS